MKQLMRYKITSGRMVEVREVLMSVREEPGTGRRKPRGKYRGKTLARQLERNCKEAVRRLARLLACNFEGGDLLVTLKYADDRLPATRDEADHQMELFMRRLSRAYRKAGLGRFPWIWVTADRSAKTGDPVRLHHHAVIPLAALDLLIADLEGEGAPGWRFWPGDQINVRHLDGSGNYTGVARYLVRNSGYDRGKRTWRSAQGLRQPEFTAPVPVAGTGGAKVPKTAHIIEREEHADPTDGFKAGYLCYILPKEGRACGDSNAGRASIRPTRSRR